MSYSFIDDLLVTPTGLLIFSFSDNEYCLDIKNVVTVINSSDNDQEVFNIDEEHKAIKFRGERISLVDSVRLFLAGKPSLSKDKRIIIVSFQGHKLAFYSDRIIEIISINKKIADDLLYRETKFNTFLSGAIEYEGRTIYALNLYQIIQEEFSFQ